MRTTDRKTCYQIILLLLAITALPVLASVHPYFNYNEQNSYTDPYRNVFRPGDNLEEVLLHGIARASQTIDIAVYEFRLPLVAKALVDKKNLGVQVRVILDHTNNFAISDIDWDNIRDEYQRRRLKDYFDFVDINKDGKLDAWEISERDAIHILRAGGIPIIDNTNDGTSGTKLMHDKFMVIDNRDVLTGSANYTMSCVHGDFDNNATRGNANNLVAFLDEPKLAKLFSEEFAIMWGSGPSGRQDSFFSTRKPHRPARRLELSNGDFVNIQFSPTSKNFGYEETTGGLINRTLGMAQHTVDMSLFVFSDVNISKALEQKYTLGELNIRAMVENQFAYQYYSDLLDMMGVQLLSEKCSPHKGSHPWSRVVTEAGVGGMIRGDLLHNKVGIVDNYYTIFGSHNWSDTANYGNDEALLVLESFDGGKAFSTEYNRQFRNAVLGIPDWLKKKLDQQERECSNHHLMGDSDFSNDLFDFGSFESPW